MWVRTGLWVLPAVSRHLELAAASEKEVALCRSGASSSSSSSSSGDGDSSGGAEGSTWLKLKLRGGGQVRRDPTP